MSRLTGRQVSVAAVVASFVYSALHIFIDPLPNPDAVPYLLAAQAWLDAGYAAAAAMYPLPYYSILVAALHALTGFSLSTSAHWLDATLIAVLVVALQRLGRALGGSVRVEIIVVVFALLLPELNGYRSFVLRDFGYWAFLVIALTCLVRYTQTQNFVRLIAFLLCCLAAALFRVEAIPVLVLMPLALLFGPAKRYRAVAVFYVMVASSIVALGYVASLLSVPTASNDWTPSTLQAGVVLLMELPVHLHAQLIGFATTVLDPRFRDYAAFGLAGGLATHDSSFTSRSRRRCHWRRLQRSGSCAGPVVRSTDGRCRSYGWRSRLRCSDSSRCSCRGESFRPATLCRLVC